MSIFKTLHIRLTFVLLLLLTFTACNNDLFIDRDLISMKVSANELDFRGDVATVTFNGIHEGEIPNVSIAASSSDNGIIDISRGEELKGLIHIDNGMLRMDIDCDENSGKIKFDLKYSLYTDTVYINVGRMINGFWQAEDLKVLPASPSTVKSIDYDDNGYYILGYSYETMRFNYVNSSEDYKTFTPVTLNLSQCKGGFNPDMRDIIASLFGNELPEVPAVVIRNGVNVKTEAKIPYSTDIVTIPGEYMTIDEPITVKVAPRALCQVKIRVRIEKCAIPYKMVVENSDIMDASVLTYGRFNLMMPIEYIVQVNNYSLETGEEIQL